MPETPPPPAPAPARDFRALVRARIGAVDIDPRREADIVDELAQHVAQHHSDLVASGVPDAEALEQALAPLADRERVAEDLTRAARRRATSFASSSAADSPSSAPGSRPVCWPPSPRRGCSPVPFTMSVQPTRARLRASPACCWSSP